MLSAAILVPSATRLKMSVSPTKWPKEKEALGTRMICSKIHLHGTTHEQSIICRQLFAGYVTDSRPMKRKEKMHHMIVLPVLAGHIQPRDTLERIKCCPSTLRRRNLKTEVLLWKRIKCFPSSLRRRNLKTQQSAVILYLCLRKTRAGKSHDYRDVILFKELRF